MSKTLEITEEPPSALEWYARVPITFEVREVLDVVATDQGLHGLRLVHRTLDAPYQKDYDADPAHDPTSWADRFDVSTWGFLVARLAARHVGGAAIAWDTPGVDMLESRRDLAVLWDLRIAPAARRQGVGTALFRRAEAWATERGARVLKVETQNVNVAACRFYARQGCRLGAIHRFAYPGAPDEAQLLWYKEVGSRTGKGLADSSSEASRDLSISVTVRPLVPRDAAGISAAFAAIGWSKPSEQYDRYLAEQKAGRRQVFVAAAGDDIAGYVTLNWYPTYPPFRAEGIPEIQDLNVLPSYRRFGIGSALMGAAEAAARKRVDTVGIRVGLTPDYGAAQRLYVRRGYVPDGRGAVWRGRAVTYGQSVVAGDDLVLCMTRRLSG